MPKESFFLAFLYLSAFLDRLKIANVRDIPINQAVTKMQILYRRASRVVRRLPFSVFDINIASRHGVEAEPHKPLC